MAVLMLTAIVRVDVGCDFYLKPRGGPVAHILTTGEAPTSIRRSVVNKEDIRSFTIVGKHDGAVYLARKIVFNALGRHRQRQRARNCYS